jgi:IS4 transposase
MRHDGYFNYRLFASIRRNEGYFISRLKGKVDPVIVAEHRLHRGRAVALVGRKLREVVETIEREILDVEVEVEFARRKYGDKTSRDTQRLRVVGLKDEATGDYHLYVTNVPPERLTPQDIARTYAARWLVEHLFKILKSHYRLEDMPSAKQVIVEALLYTALLTAVVGDRLLDAVRRKLASVRIPMMRWATVLASQAQDILLLMVRPARETKLALRLVSTTLLAEAADPNVNRPNLLEAVETQQHKYRRKKA